MVARYFKSIFDLKGNDPMNITLENTGPCRQLLKVEFSAEEIQKEYDDSLAMYAKHGTVKGFRPGKAPVEMIRRLYDKKILEGLDEHLLAKGFREAAKKHKLDPVAELDLQKSDLRADAPFSFSLTLDVAPEFDLPTYKGLEVEAKKVEIAEDAITQAIDRYRESTGKYEDVKDARPVKEGDMVAVDYTATVDGKPMADLSDKAKSLATGSDFWVIANEQYSFLPAFGPQLVGMKVGDAKDISVEFDDTAPVEELRGKTGVFASTVKTLRERVLPPMDEAFFKSVQVKDEAELRNTFRGLLKNEADGQETTRRRNQLIETLLKAATFDVPESEMESESQRIVYEMVEENTKRGIAEEEIRKNLSKISESAKTAAKDRVKLRYLLKKVAKQEKLDVTDAEVSSLMNAHAMRSGFPSAKEWLKKANLKEKEVRSSIRQDLLTSKTIDLLLDAAKLTGEGAVEAKPEEKKAAPEKAKKEEPKKAKKEEPKKEEKA